MAAFSKIKVGQVLYTVTRQRAGNTTMFRKAVHEVKIVEIDHEKLRVLASWNYNTPRWFYYKDVRRWKVNKPVADKL